jgi:hypothetical protein
MKTKKLRLSALLGAGALALTAVVAGSAIAGKPTAKTKVRQVSQQLQLPPQSTNAGVAETTVACPKGTTVTGGGATYPPGTPLSNALVAELFESGPSGNGWHVRHDNDTAGNTPVTTTASALCLKNKGLDGKAKVKIKQASLPVQLPPQSTNLGVAEFDVACPKGTQVVGGGVVFAAGTALTDSIQLFESGPSSNGWHARIDNDTPDIRNATVSARCLANKLKVKGSKAKAVTKVRSIDRAVQLPAQATNLGLAEFDVACPNGFKLVGGGSLFAAGTPITVDTELFESGPSGNAWHVRYDNDQAQVQGASVHALCLKGKLKVK